MVALAGVIVRILVPPLPGPDRSAGTASGRAPVAEVVFHPAASPLGALDRCRRGNTKLMTGVAHKALSGKPPVYLGAEHQWDRTPDGLLDTAY